MLQDTCGDSIQGNRKKGSDREQFLFLNLTNKVTFLRSLNREVAFGFFFFLNVGPKLFLNFGDEQCGNIHLS